MRASLFVIPTIGLVIGIIQCALVGGVVRHWLGAKTSGKPWALDTAVGIVVLAAYFTVRSLAFGCFFGEPFFVVAALCLWRPELRPALVEHRTRLLELAAIVGTTLAWGHWYFYRLDPASSDPAVIAAIVESARQGGRLALQLTSGIDAVLAYPMGIQALTWAILNPLLPSVNAVHIWLSLTVSLAAFSIADLYAFKAARARDVWIALAWAALIRLSLGAFDVSETWLWLEGASKRSLAFLCVVAIAAALHKRAWLALLALAFLTLVNPTNAYLSVLGFILVMAFVRPRWTELAAFFAFVGIALLQDGYLRSGGTDAPTHSAAFWDSLPPLATQPWLLLLPSWEPLRESRSLALGSSGLAALGLFVAPQRVRRYLVSAWVLVPVLIMAQVALFLFIGRTPQLLTSYTQVVYLNFWQAVFFAMTLGGAIIATRFVITPGRLRPLAAMVLIGALVTGAREVSAMGPRAHVRGGRIGDRAFEFARIFRALRERATASDRVLLTGFVSNDDFEPWYFPSFELAALHAYVPALPLIGTISFPGFWPRAMPSIAEHARRVCAADCAYLDSLGVTMAIDMREMSTLCEQPAEPILLKCFSIEERIDTGPRRATIYRRRFSD